MDANKPTPIPEHFASVEEAGEFWDEHSAADYLDLMEEIEVEFDIQRRTYLVPVSDGLYHRAKAQAEAEERSAEEVINLALERELA